MSSWTCACASINPADSRFCPQCGARRADTAADALQGAATLVPRGPGPSAAPAVDGTLSGGQTRMGTSAAAQPAVQPGSFVGRDQRYQLVALLGEGGMGSVWRARDQRLEREVAIKRIRGLGALDATLRERFRRETQALLRLSHPSIVAVFDADEDADGAFMVMQLVQGTSLAAVLARGPVPLAQAVDWFRALCRGMAHAHKKGVIHRDLKPSNVMVDEDGHAMLLDFGLVRQAADADLSLTGVGMGTLDYAAPEQRMDASRADARSDVYGLGRILYELLTGRRPVPLHLHKAPQEWFAVLERATEPEPSQRFASVDELLAAVDAVRVAPAVQVRPPAAKGALAEREDVPPVPPAPLREVEAPSGYVPAEGSKRIDGHWDRIRHKATGIVLRRIPAGEFLMGSPEKEEGRADDERQHRRSIEQPFYLGETEVTQAQWQRVMGVNPSHFRGDDLPVEQVNWEDCQAFCTKAGNGLRLPSEAEWEYACRAGTTTPFSFGETIDASQANYNGKFAYGKGKKGPYRETTVNCGSLPANAWGLHEMHGNVLEWCEDVYGDYPQAGTQAAAGGAGGQRVLRGGSWSDGPVYCRAADRDGNGADDRYDVGFRVARTAAP